MISPAKTYSRADPGSAARLQQALAFHKQGQLGQAECLYREILLQAPAHFDALHMLGVIELQKKNFAASLELIGRAVEINPHHPAAHSNHGSALHNLKRYEEALASYERALALKADYAEALFNRGSVLRDLKRHEEALASLERALARRPDYVAALINRGAVLQDLKRDEEALASFERALELKADSAEAFYNRGNVLQALKRHEEALASFERAVMLKPDSAGAFYNRGNTLCHLKRHEDALASFERALALKSDYAEAFNSRGAALQELNRHDEAQASYERALALKPDYADAHQNLGHLLKAEGRMDEAAVCYRKALLLNPDKAEIHHALIFAMNRAALDGADIFAQCRIFAAQFEQNTSQLSHRNTRIADRKLKIGYVSGDFCDHPVVFYVEPILANHDRQAVEVHCYYNRDLIDHVTERLQRYPEHWRSIVNLSDDEVAALVQRDGIDILVDLSGHTSYNRLLTFARKPAPVQVTWIGLPATTGLSAMDYRLTNHSIDPVGMTERYHSETLFRLSGSACFQPEVRLPSVHELPALSKGFVTFASFNEANKISPAVYALWSKILALLPDSRLLMICDAQCRKYARQTFMSHGIAPERLIFPDRLPLVDYLALHNEVDIALDSFPYNGSTITRHALSMGVPVVSLAGSRAVSRVGLALMSQLGLESFVGQSEEEYVQIALRWARDLEGLAGVRRTLRQRVQEAPFNDARARTREVEAAYRQMWRTWCAA